MIGAQVQAEYVGAAARDMHPMQPKLARESNPVAAAGVRLEQSISVLDRTVDELCGRLASVRSQNTLTGRPEQNAPLRTGNSPVAINLHCQADRIDALTEVITNVIRELEI